MFLSRMRATQQKANLNLKASDNAQNLNTLFFILLHILEWLTIEPFSDKKLGSLQFYNCEHENKTVTWNFTSAATNWREYATEGEAAQLGCSPSYMSAPTVCAEHKS